jgi:hypothetical protein
MSWTPDNAVRFAIQLQDAVRQCTDAGFTFPITALIVSCAGATVVLRFVERGADPITLLERSPDESWELPAFGAFIDPVGCRGEFNFMTTDGVLEALRN